MVFLLLKHVWTPTVLAWILDYQRTTAARQAFVMSLAHWSRAFSFA
jgi:hypothetical protein